MIFLAILRAHLLHSIKHFRITSNNLSQWESSEESVAELTANAPKSRAALMQRTICGLGRQYRAAIRQHRTALNITSAHEPRGLPLSTKPRELFECFPRRRFADYADAHPGNFDEHILSRSHQYGITSKLDLDRESNFDAKPENRNCMVDELPYRQDLKLWNILLDYRLHHYGSRGAMTIWRGLKFRKPRIDLDSEDDLTNVIWQKLIQCAAEYDDVSLTKRLCERYGIAWRRPRLFTETMVPFLRAGRESQLEFICNTLRERSGDGTADMLDLYNVFQPKSHNELRAFFSVYEKFRPGKMYGKIVHHLFENGQPKQGILLHKFLISKGDFPSSFSEIEPLLKHLARRSEDPGPFMRSLAAAGIVFSGQGKWAYEHENQDIALDAKTSTATRKMTSGAPRLNKISDSIAAKAFATPALPFEFVLNSLRAFGLTEVGSQSIREIGLAASNLEALSIRLAKLDELGVDTGGSAYSRFIRKMCSMREGTLLHQALSTDMHHDVFEDSSLQQRLLVQSLNKCDWANVNLLLAILNHGQVLQLNQIVTSAILLSIVKDGLKSRTFLTLLPKLVGPKARLPATLFRDLADNLIIRLRNMREKEMSQSDFRGYTRFTVGVLQSCAAGGNFVSDAQWRMLILQLVKSEAFEDLQTLTIWLSVWLPKQEQDAGTGEQSVTKSSRSLARIFDCRLQGAIAYCALKNQFYRRDGRVRHPWQTTLKLLRYLQRDSQVTMQLPTIRKAITLFVRGLYRRSAPGFAARKFDTRKSDSRRLCFKLFKTLAHFWPRYSDVAEQERELVGKYLLVQKPQRACDADIASRPSLRKALRRF